MIRKFFDRLTGRSAESALDRAGGREPLLRCNGKPYYPPEGSIELPRMTAAQRLVADIFVIRVRGYCELHHYDFANFHGPFLWPVVGPDHWKLAEVVLGQQAAPGYDAWELEVASPAGVIAGLGDNKGEFRIYKDGMMLSDRRS